MDGKTSLGSCCSPCSASQGGIAWFFNQIRACPDPFSQSRLTWNSTECRPWTEPGTASRAPRLLLLPALFEFWEKRKIGTTNLFAFADRHRRLSAGGGLFRRPGEGDGPIDPMAENGRTVTVQIGQCGNQLGSDFFSALADGAVSDAAAELPAFFRPGRYDTSPAVPRAVLIDAEPRVVTEVSRRNRVAPPAWRYDPVQPSLKAVWESGAASGSANNWAMGYNVQSEVLAECVREGVRREAEQADAMQVTTPFSPTALAVVFLP